MCTQNDALVLKALMRAMKVARVHKSWLLYHVSAQITLLADVFKDKFVVIRFR